jgi:protein-histidine pros-kinase
VVTAADGQEALDVLSDQEVDLVLMDVEMPRLNGLEAVGALRGQERATGGHLPVIAMTAHAMKGDRDRCLEAGMDDYLSKPIDAESLATALVRWSNANLQNEDGPMSSEESCVEAAVYDRQAALEIADNSEELLAEIIDLFFQTYEQIVARIRGALASGDASSLAGAAHEMKGVLANIGAQRARQQALVIEQMGREGQCQTAVVEVEKLEDELRELRGALRAEDGEARQCKS